MITGRCDPFCVPSFPSSVVEPEVGHQGESQCGLAHILRTPAFQACDPNQNQTSVEFGFAGSADAGAFTPVPNPESLADPRRRWKEKKAREHGKGGRIGKKTGQENTENERKQRRKKNSRSKRYDCNARAQDGSIYPAALLVWKYSWVDNRLILWLHTFVLPDRTQGRSLMQAPKWSTADLQAPERLTGEGSLRSHAAGERISIGV